MKNTILLLLLFVCTEMFAQTSSEYLTLNDISFKAPAGWQKIPNNNMQVFVSPGATQDNQAMIILAQSEPFTTAFKDVFEQAIHTTFNGMKIISQSEVKADKTTDGYDVLMKAVSAEGDGGNKLFSMFVALNINQRMTIMTLAATSDALFAKHQADMMQFIANVLPPGKSTGNTQHYNTANTTGTPEKTAPAVNTSTTPEQVGRNEDARRRPNMVEGNIYDAQGRPFNIPGAKVEVHIWGSGSNGDRAGFTFPVDVNGHYASQVPSGLYGFDAHAFMPLNGNIVRVGLEPMDGRPANQAIHSAPGIVKDFQLKLTGPIACGDLSAVQGYYGGAITITDGDDWNNPIFGSLTKTYPAGSKVIVTLTPQSPLIDGSQGSVIILECEIEKMAGGGIHRANIPLAAYRVTAKIVMPGGQQKRMRVGALPNLNFADAVNIYYEPDGTPDARPIIPNILVASY